MRSTPNIQSAPLISFIVCTYNLPVALIEQCLHSLLSLSLSDDEREIILVDDGSEVSPLNDMLELRDTVIYVRQPNGGLSEARNRGLQVATGQFVQFIDGDDYLIQTSYEHCLDIVRYRPDCDMVLFYETDKVVAEVPFTIDGPMTGVAYMHQNNLRGSACGYIFKRSILGTLRFQPGILHEDEDFTPQLMLRAEHLYATAAKAYFYRQRDASIMTSRDKKHTAKRLTDMRNIIFHLHDIAQHAPEIDRVALNRRVAQLSMDYLYNTIQLTHSHHQLMEAIQGLRQKGLFPLSDKDYTRKYAAFRRLVNSAVGRRLLLLTLR
jgi:hypothetical protein